MAVEGAKTLDECRQRLKEKLDHCFVRNDDDEPTKRFARRGVTREIFEQDRLDHLILLLYQDSTNTSHREASDSRESITKKIRGSQGSRSPPCCNFLAILIYSECKDQTLMRFIEHLPDGSSSSPTFDDSTLPLKSSEACDAFGEVDGHKFWIQQYLFCPVVLKERDEAIYVDHKKACPRPFVEEPKEIGQGAYAIVYRVVIEKGHLINNQGANEVGSCPNPSGSTSNTDYSGINTR